MVRNAQRFDRGPEPLSRKAGAHEDEHRVTELAAELGTRGVAQCRRDARMEVVEINTAIDDMELLRRNAKAAPDLVRHHTRVADHRTQPWMLEKLALGAAYITMIGIERDAEALDRRPDMPAQLQPAPMDAVPRAIY